MSQRVLVAGPAHVSVASAAIVLVVYEALPLGIPRQAGLARRLKRMQALLELLESNASFSLSLYITTKTLDAIHHSPLATALQRFVGESRLELLTGGAFAPLLPAMPEHDAAAQLSFHQAQLKAMTGQEASGVWLTGQAFSPSLLPVLVGSGLRYTILNQQQLTAVAPALLPGVPLYVTERLGQRLLLLGSHTVLSEALRSEVTGQASDGSLIPSTVEHGGAQPELVEPTHTWLAPRLQRWFEDLRAVAQLPASLAVLSCPLDEDLDQSPDHEPAAAGEGASDGRDPFVIQITRLVAAISEHPDRFTLQLPRQVVDHFAPCAMSWPGESVPPLTGLRLMSPERAEVLEQVGINANGAPLQVPEASISNTLMALATQLPWEVTLARYPEQNRLHKRLLLMSGRLTRLARILQDRGARGEDSELQLRAYRRAQLAMMEAWCHASLWPGSQEGMSRPWVRAYVRSKLAEIQRMLDLTQLSETRYVQIEQLDLDRDTREELLISTPCLDALISTQGGAMLELQARSPFISLCDLPQRRQERFHAPLIRSGVSPVKRRPVRELKPFDPQLHALASHLKQDRYARGCFIDHLLGQGTTLENFASSRYQEAGTLLQSSYEIMGVNYQREAGIGQILLAQNTPVLSANVSTSGASRPTIRVEKRYQFLDQGRQLEVKYVLINRGHSPVSFTFAVELGFNQGLKPGAPITLDSQGRMARGEQAHAHQFHLTDPETHARINATLTPSARLWWFPLDLILPDARGRLALEPQGHVFLSSWEIALWGEEQRVLTLCLSLEFPPASVTTWEDETHGTTESRAAQRPPHTTAGPAADDIDSSPDSVSDPSP